MSGSHQSFTRQHPNTPHNAQACHLLHYYTTKLFCLYNFLAIFLLSSVPNQFNLILSSHSCNFLSGYTILCLPLLFSVHNRPFKKTQINSCNYEGVPEGTPEGGGVYLTVYPELSPNTDIMSF